MKFSQKYFHVALARSAILFSIIKERELYENHENSESLAQQIFPRLQYSYRYKLQNIVRHACN